MANLYGAYRGAGKAGGAYASSLQGIMDIEAEQEHSKQMFDIGQEESGRKFAAGQQAIGLLSTFAGGEVEQKEVSADIKKAFPKAEQTVGETKITDLLNPFKMEGGKVKWEGFGKAPGLGKGENVWGEIGERLNVLVGGKERKWNIPEGMKGIEAGEHKQSDLLPAAKYSLYGESSLNNYGDDDDDDKGGSSDDCPPGQKKSKYGVCYKPKDKWGNNLSGQSDEEE